MISDFIVESLGPHHADYFHGYGREGYDHSTYGIGDTEAEALDECLEHMAEQTEDFTNKIEQRIRAAFRPQYPNEACDPEDLSPPYFHVGIRWNETLRATPESNP